MKTRFRSVGPLIPRERIVASLTWLAVALTAPIAAAETGALSGVVAGPVGDAPLAGALVSVVGTDQVTTTSAEGRFYFPSLPVGARTVRVSYLGFDPKDVPVDISAQRATPIDIRLGTET